MKIREIPNALLWIFESYDLKNKRYLKDLEFIKENMSVNYVVVSVRNGVQLQNLQQCHGVMQELVARAHELGLKVALHFTDSKGFYNSIFQTNNIPAVDQVELFPIPDPKKAAALVNDVELVTDENGFAEYTFTPQWARKKIMPIYSEIVRAYAFDKTADGFYAPDSLCEVTDRIVITESRTHQMSFEIDLGKEQANRNVFVMVAQYYNYPSMAEAWGEMKGLIDAYADIPLDGVQLDEYGYLFLNTADLGSDFRGRHYSVGMSRYYRNELGQELERLLFDMRYAPQGEEAVRIRAINTYFETLRVFPLEVEKKVYAYAKERFGDQAYVNCHNTFHNSLESDEIWRTACNWWDIPRDFGHTDENIGFPVRWGVMLACRNPIMIDMYYSKKSETHYKHIIEGAPYNCREFHHAFNDFYWGSSFTEPEFLKNIRLLDDAVATLNDFQTVYPKMDLLVVYGAAAQNNWYPNVEARSKWDIDGTLHIQKKCDRLWADGYRCALVPDYAIEDGRITQKDGKVSFGGQEFDGCLFLYPKYAKKETYAFLNRLHRDGGRVAVCGASGVDFYGQAVELTAPHFEEFAEDIPARIGCLRSGIEGGCVYNDNSFSLVGDGLLTQEPTEFAFTLDGKRISGKHTGLLAYRAQEAAFATAGSELFIDGEPIALKSI